MLSTTNHEQSTLPEDLSEEFTVVSRRSARRTASQTSHPSKSILASPSTVSLSSTKASLSSKVSSSPTARLSKVTPPAGRSLKKSSLQSILLREGVCSHELKNTWGVGLTVLSNDHPADLPPPCEHDFSGHQVKMHPYPCRCRELSSHHSMVESLLEEYSDLRCYLILVFQPASWLGSHNSQTLYVALVSSALPRQGCNFPDGVEWLLDLLLHDSVSRRPELAAYLAARFDPNLDEDKRSRLTGAQSVYHCQIELARSADHYNSGTVLMGPQNLLHEIRVKVGELPGTTEYELVVLSWSQLCALACRQTIGMTMHMIEWFRTQRKYTGQYFLIGKPHWRPAAYEFSFGKREYMRNRETSLECAIRELYEEYRIYLDQDIWDKTLDTKSGRIFHEYYGRYYLVDLTGTVATSHTASIQVSFPGDPPDDPPGDPPDDLSAKFGSLQLSESS